MKAIKKVEEEINQIRLKIYEETKDLTPEQYRERLDRITKAAVQKYGIRVVISAHEE
jgi:hypothetical protein